jgi:hypothetical protein
LQVFDEVVYEKLQVSKKQDGLSVIFTSAYLLAQFADFLIVSQKNMTARATLLSIVFSDA